MPSRLRQKQRHLFERSTRRSHAIPLRMRVRALCRALGQVSSTAAAAAEVLRLFGRAVGTVRAPAARTFAWRGPRRVLHMLTVEQDWTPLPTVESLQELEAQAHYRDSDLTFT